MWVDIIYLNTEEGTSYIKNIDGEKGELEFTEDVNEALRFDGEWDAETRCDWIKFHFKEKYPEVENLEFTEKEIDVDEEYDDEDED